MHLSLPITLPSLSLLFSYNTHPSPSLACAHTRTHDHTCANTLKGCSVCDAALGARAGYKQQGVWQRRGWCVGRPYAFHQALMKKKSRLAHFITRSIVASKHTLSYLLSHTQHIHPYNKSCTGFKWYTPTGIFLKTICNKKKKKSVNCSCSPSL